MICVVIFVLVILVVVLVFVGSQKDIVDIVVGIDGFSIFVVVV